MAYNFIECNRFEQYLLPPSILDWVEEGELVWFILDAVKPMDLRAIYRKYRPDGCGSAAFEPTMMVSLLLYAYCEGNRSSRKIEKLCRRDVSYKALTANQTPDHTTIARFRRRHQAELQGLFTQVLRLCVEAGVVKVGVVALDGTKMKANAALEANRTQSAIVAEVKKMLEEAEQQDTEEDRLYGADRRGDELPNELQKPESRLARLKACQERLEHEAEAARRKQEERIEAREEEEKETGEKKRGRKPKRPEEVVKTEAKANVTDPESRILKTRKGYVQGYNAQTVVTEEQYIVAVEVTQEENDVKQLHPMVQRAEQEVAKAGLEEAIGVVLGDAGYWSEENIQEAPEAGPELLINTKKDWKQRKEAKESPSPRGRIPSAFSEKERMERKLRSQRGRDLYRKRGQTVEPVFGQIKVGRGCEGFLRRGLAACQSEWALLSSTHNLLKLWKSGKALWN